MKSPFSLVAIVAVAACGGSSPSSTDVAAYQRSLLSASSAVTTYRSATQSMATPADCQAAAQQYGAQMGAAIEAMHQHSASMDEHMRSLGQPSAADMTCGADAMAQQLQQHMGVACTSGDVTQNRAVAALHCQEMASDADHLQMRAAGMGATFVGGDMHGGMMGTGGCTGMDCMVDGGYTAPDGHHMDWGEPMHGCTSCGGAYCVSDAGTTATTGG